jgi:hypothetical protein
VVLVSDPQKKYHYLVSVKCSLPGFNKRSAKAGGRWQGGELYLFFLYLFIAIDAIFTSSNDLSRSYAHKNISQSSIDVYLSRNYSLHRPQHE